MTTMAQLVLEVLFICLWARLKSWETSLRKLEAGTVVEIPRKLGWERWRTLTRNLTMRLVSEGLSHTWKPDETCLPLEPDLGVLLEKLACEHCSKVWKTLFGNPGRLVHLVWYLVPWKPHVQILFGNPDCLVGNRFTCNPYLRTGLLNPPWELLSWEPYFVTRAQQPSPGDFTWKSSFQTTLELCL